MGGIRRDISRFERHVDIPEIGIKGQQKIFAAKVLVVGVGGLGCPAALYLAMAGVGDIGLADADTVSISNLQRQVLFDEVDVDMPKVEAAYKALIAKASTCKIQLYNCNVSDLNAEAIISNYDIVLDCSDNFPTRFLLNKVCTKLGRPLVSAALYHHDGQVAIFKPFSGVDSPCYECIYSSSMDTNVVPTCTQSGIVGPVAGILGTMQATLAVKEIVGIGEEAAGNIMMFNAIDFSFQRIRAHKNLSCSVCGEGVEGSKNSPYGACSIERI